MLKIKPWQEFLCALSKANTIPGFCFEPLAVNVHRQGFRAQPFKVPVSVTSGSKHGAHIRAPYAKTQISFEWLFCLSVFSRFSFSCLSENWFI